MRGRIPTGIQQLSGEFKQKRLIAYKCTECGKRHVYEYQLKTTQQAVYHVFGGRKAREAAEKKVREKAVAALEKKDAEMFEEINDRQEYSRFYEPVTCPSCNAVQPWSNMPRPWMQTTLCGLWLAGVIMFGLFTCMVLFVAKNVMPSLMIFLIPLLILLALPLIRKQKRDKAMEAIHALSMEPLKYYNNTNIHELKNEQVN